MFGQALRKNYNTLVPSCNFLRPPKGNLSFPYVFCDSLEPMPTMAGQCQAYNGLTADELFKDTEYMRTFKVSDQGLQRGKFEISQGQLACKQLPCNRKARQNHPFCHADGSLTVIRYENNNQVSLKVFNFISKLVKAHTNVS